MAVRFLKADGDVSLLETVTHLALTDAGYTLQPEASTEGELSKIEIYVLGDKVVIAKYTKGPKFVTHDSQGVTTGECEGRLYLNIEDPAEVARIDRVVDSVKPEDL